MNENEQMIREQAYELWDHAGGRTVRATNSGSLREPNSNAEEETGEGDRGADVPKHGSPSRHEPSADQGKEGPNPTGRS